MSTTCTCDDLYYYVSKLLMWGNNYLILNNFFAKSLVSIVSKLPLCNPCLMWDLSKCNSGLNVQ